MYVQKAPVSKRELLNRLLSNDFDGNFHTLGDNVRVSRVSASTFELRFDDIDRTFLLSAHIPRGDKPEDDFAAPLPPPTTRRPGKKQ